MTPEKLKRLRAAGWHAGTPKEFLKMTDAEAALVDIKLALTDALRQTRIKRKLSQTDLAQRIKSSQSRVAKIEAGGCLGVAGPDCARAVRGGRNEAGSTESVRVEDAGRGVAPKV